MENEKAVLGALLFIVMVVGANFVMYAIARGAANAKGRGFWETIGKAMNTSTKKNDEMEELRRKMEALKKNDDTQR